MREIVQQFARRRSVRYLGRDATEAWVEIHTPETLERTLPAHSKRSAIEHTKMFASVHM